MPEHGRGSTALDEYESRFGTATPCLIDDAVAQRLMDRLGAKDLRGDRRELVIDSTKEALAAPPSGASASDLPTGYYYIFSLCERSEEGSDLDRARWMPFRFYNATRASSRTFLPEVSADVTVMRFESKENLVAYAVIFQAFTVYFGGEAKPEEVKAVIDLFKFAVAE